MWKFIILAAAAYLLYRLFANDFLKKKKDDEIADKKEREQKIAAGEMVKDPECGTWVAKDGSLTVRDGDAIHHFCSYECRDKFLKRLEAGGRVLSSRKNGDEDGAPDN